MTQRERSVGEKVRIFKDLFAGLQEVYGTYDPATGKVRQEKKPVTHEVILAHLRGGRPYGVYLLTGSTTRALVVDFDQERLELPVSYVAAATQCGLSAYIERSKSKGYHVWMFFESKGVPARKARLVAKRILVDMGAPETEVFPKQDELTDGVSYGNFINAPLFGRLVPKGRTVFADPTIPTEVHPDQWELLARAKKHTEEDLNTVIERFHLEVRDRAPAKEGDSEKTGPDVSAFGLPPCARKILAEGVSAYQRVSCFRLAVHLKRNGIPHDLALVVLKAWAKKNRPADGRGVITDQEIEYQARCAFSRPYRSFGCEHAAMAAYCHHDCPLYPYTVGKSLATDHHHQEDSSNERKEPH
ncbi:MAG: hypothetical protein ABFE13_25605 [Phycisphaerales bacterium]